MVEIKKISMSDIPIIKRGPRGQTEYNAVRALEEGEAISFPCRWKHGDRSNCSGVANIKAIAQNSQHPQKIISAICIDGIVKVGRYQ